MAKLLLDHGADANSVCTNTATALAVACQKGHTDVAKVLFEHGADVTVHTRWGTPLKVARDGGHVDIVHVLEHGVERWQ